MARIRTIKPSFAQDEDLSDLPAETHLLAATLLPYADDEGYFKANPKLVKAQCCPLREDPTEVEESLRQLHEAGYIRLFTGTDGKRYGKVRKFSEHQKVNKPYPSKIKELEPVQEDSGNVHGIRTKDSPPEGKGMEGNGIGMEPCTPPSGEPSKRDLLWESVLDVCGVSGKEPTKSERGAWNKAVKEIRDAGGQPGEVAGRAERYREIYPKATLTPTALARHWSQCAAVNDEPEEHYI